MDLDLDGAEPVDIVDAKAAPGGEFYYSEGVRQRG
jgi:hypothetical protein